MFVTQYVKGIDMGLKKTGWADRFNYKHHSNPSTPDAWTFFDKAYLRVQHNKAWQILTGKIKGDEQEARKILRDSGHYKDCLGLSQYKDNPNMVSGRAAQVYADRLLVDDASPNEAMGDAINLLQGFQGGHWRDADKDNLIIAHRERIYYDAEGKRSKKGDLVQSEFSLVCDNAAQGVREAMQGANRIIGEIDLFGHIPHCQLPYFGKPDYGEGRVELKTQWDQAADTDSPRANSLPKKIKAPHLMQLAGYWHLSKIVPKIVYANRLGYVILEPTLDELQFALDNIVQACKRREKLMQVADDLPELLSLTDPQFAESFVWRDLNPDILIKAKQLFGSKK
tara:strand:- start:123 stop:1139 length:1017 start_codon:yes stop_codon:yes gene_type:complete